jgi:hypothetical protein
MTFASADLFATRGAMELFSMLEDWHRKANGVTSYGDNNTDRLDGAIHNVARKDGRGVQTEMISFVGMFPTERSRNINTGDQTIVFDFEKARRYVEGKLVREIDGVLRCVRCGTDEGVKLKPSMTAYYWDETGEDPNGDIAFCDECAEGYREQMESQWADYYHDRL